LHSEFFLETANIVTVIAEENELQKDMIKKQHPHKVE
jgi:hypothetical protein